LLRNATSNTLQWQTGVEKSMGYFEVLKSYDSTTFFTIGTVKATNQNGVNNYTYTDKNVFNTTTRNQTLYYKLRVYNAEGCYTELPLKQVVVEPSLFQTVIFPNPSTGTIFINYPNLKSIRIIDAIGRVLYTEQLANSTNFRTLNIGYLATGVYFIQLINEIEGMQTTKLLKQ
jgi:hypothetical protein